MHSIHRRLLCVALATVGLTPLIGIAAPPAQAAGFTPLTLKNGWTNAPFGTRNAAKQITNGIVQLKGAIETAGTNPVPFVLPLALRPATDVYVPIDVCNSRNGRLVIKPSGTVSVKTEGAFSDAQCFTSLDGASFARVATGFTALTLQNGWTNAPFGTSNAASKLISGIVHLKGAIAGGSSSVVFTLPAGHRPLKNTYVPVDLCDATKGRLLIQPSGSVTVQAAGAFSTAQCFTSLDGASFARNATGFSTLTLQNGWTGNPFSTSSPATKVINGVVTFKGAITTAGTNSQSFTLPVGQRPSGNVYVLVDQCDANRGRLLIQANGLVNVQSESSFANAQCFTSLEGASFGL